MPVSGRLKGYFIRNKFFWKNQILSLDMVALFLYFYAQDSALHKERSKKE